MVVRERDAANARSEAADAQTVAYKDDVLKLRNLNSGLRKELTEHIERNSRLASSNTDLRTEIAGDIALVRELRGALEEFLKGKP
jgi:hypothetical protein